MSPEGAVRAYLDLLSVGAESLPDDPVERLLLRARLERAFVQHAAAWARERGVSGAAFAEEGVPWEVLHRAGLGQRSSRPDDEMSRSIRAAIPARQPFSEGGLMTRTGATRQAVRSVIAEDLQAGRIEEHAVSEIEGRAGTRLYRRAW